MRNPEGARFAGYGLRITSYEAAPGLRVGVSTLTRLVRAATLASTLSTGRRIRVSAIVSTFGGEKTPHLADVERRDLCYC